MALGIAHDLAHMRVVAIVQVGALGSQDRTDATSAGVTRRLLASAFLADALRLFGIEPSLDLASRHIDVLLELLPGGVLIRADHRCVLRFSCRGIAARSAC